MRMSACSFLRRKTQAAIPTANAPEPSAVSTITLNVFQMPHPKASFIPLTGPKPGQFAVAGQQPEPSESGPPEQEKMASPPETPNTGTARSHWLSFRIPFRTSLRTSVLNGVFVIALIAAPSNRSLSHDRALPPRGPSRSCGSPAPVPHTGPPVAQSTGRNAAASASVFAGTDS